MASELERQLRAKPNNYVLKQNPLAKAEVWKNIFRSFFSEMLMAMMKPTTTQKLNVIARVITAEKYMHTVRRMAITLEQKIC